MIAGATEALPIAEAAAWKMHARELAAWAMRQANRTDRYGKYYFSKETQSFGKIWAPADAPKDGALSEQVLFNHFYFPQADHRAGLATTNPPGNTTANPESNTCRWGAIDIDCHDDSVDPTATLDCALKLYETLSGMGFNPLLTTSDGKGGYHLRILFNEPTPSKPLFYFLKSLVKNFADFGFSEEPEIFPKQPALPHGGYGNWLRMIGKHHKHDHYSTVYTGERWLKGEEAIQFILAMEWNSPALVPPLKETKPTSSTSKKKGLKPPTSQDRRKVVEVLSHLSPKRADVYDDWIHVGQAVHRVFAGSDTGLELWRQWSEQSSEYQEGVCEAKWATFKLEGENRIGLKRLIEWGEEDSKGALLKALDRIEGYIRNYREEVVSADPNNPDGKEHREIIPLTIQVIINRIQEATNNWPRQVSGALFIHENGSPLVHWLEKSSALFGWLNSRTGLIHWKNNGEKTTGLATQEEVFAELRRVSTRYEAIEAYPHYPPLDGRYYLCGTIAPGKGDKLRQLVSMFAPATDADSDLILAMILSLFWGGPCGATPCFMITSDDGRGAGKTTFAELLSDLVGGYIAVSVNEDITKLKERLLSPDALTKRMALIDNMKSLKFSWGELEGLLTAKTISGRRMYVGEFQRPNNVVWAITLNGPSLSEDMAQRCVVIKLAKQEYRPTWREDVQKFIDENRAEIIADAIGILREGGDGLKHFSRWAAWERDVLSCVAEPGEAQKVIVERQGETNVDNDEAEIIEEHFADRLAELNYDPEISIVRIPRSIAAEWYIAATNDRQLTAKISRNIGQFIKEKKLKRLQDDPSHNHGRCWLWFGSAADPTDTPSNDIESRIEHFNRNKRGDR